MNFNNTYSVACWLIIATLISILFSPPLVSLAQILLVLVILSSKELRNKMFNTWQQPMIKSSLIFYALISIGVLYSIAPWNIAINSWWGWRKLLLLPLALILFDNSVWKHRLLIIFISVTTAIATVSFLFWSIGYAFPWLDAEIGVLLRNRITQGMIFSVAAFSAAMLTLINSNYIINYILITCSTILIANIILITPGRSGYLATLVLILIGVTSYLRQKQWSWFKSIGIASLAASFLVIILILAPISKQRLTQVVEEAINYQQYNQETSVGIRVMYWKNTISLLDKHPLFGHGTGAFGTAYTRNVAGKPGIAGVAAEDPHNQFLRIWVEYGALGLIVFILLLSSAAWQQPITLLYRMLGLSVMVAWCVTSLANSHFTTFAEGSFIYLWLGTMLAAETSTHST